MSCPDILKALLVVRAKWQLRVSLFLNANWTSGWDKEKKANLTSRLSGAECIFYELEDPSQSRLKPVVVMFVRCQAPLLRNPSSSILMELTTSLKKSFALASNMAVGCISKSVDKVARSPSKLLSQTSIVFLVSYVRLFCGQTPLFITFKCTEIKETASKPNEVTKGKHFVCRLHFPWKERKD